MLQIQNWMSLESPLKQTTSEVLRYSERLLFFSFSVQQGSFKLLPLWFFVLWYFWEMRLNRTKVCEAIDEEQKYKSQSNVVGTVCKIKKQNTLKIIFQPILNWIHNTQARYLIFKPINVIMFLFCFISNILPFWIRYLQQVLQKAGTEVLSL